MSMSTHVIGFIPPDEQWQKMKAIYDACIDANVKIPKEVGEFFDYVNPKDMPGREVDIKKSIRPYSANSREGFTVDITSLPKNVKWVRFYNSY